MKKLILYLMSIVILSSCANEAQNDESESIETVQNIVDSTLIESDDLIEIEGNRYTEYYDGKKQIKFQGNQDENGKRHGKWVFFSEDGEERSMTLYKNGLKHGHSIVKYPDGGIHYLGEYSEDKQVGIWKTYNPDGSLAESKDFGYPEK